MVELDDESKVNY